MKVLVVSVDVSNLSEDEIDDLEISMHEQTEDYNAEVINSGVKTLEVEEEEELH